MFREHRSPGRSLSNSLKPNTSTYSDWVSTAATDSCVTPAALAAATIPAALVLTLAAALALAEALAAAPGTAPDG